MIALKFIRKHWQPLVIIFIVSVLYIRVKGIINERDEALNTLKAERLANDIAVAEQKAINAQLKLQGQQSVKSITDKHNADLKIIGEKYGQDINRMRSTIADRLREQSSKNDSARVPENDTNQSTSENSDTNFARQDDYKMMYQGAQVYIKTLEQAGAMCASDFNLCKSYVDSEQQRLGVE